MPNINKNNIPSLNNNNMKGKRVLTLGRRSLDSKNQHKTNKSNVNISINRNSNKLEKLNSNSNFITKKKNYKI